ncbi:MAG TPA: hypothetical protein P5342_03230, partial [Candidatus Cloacimonadota bacterium]|nr:hypothetical protein [Candidatus Cloacimonadota bacterium]
KRMKDKGFKIENDTIVIPELTALCDFCDQDIKDMCSAHGTPDCPNSECNGKKQPVQHSKSLAI